MNILHNTPPLTFLATALVAVTLALPMAATATSVCTAPYRYKGAANTIQEAENRFIQGGAKYIVNPTYPHTPCARLCRYYTTVIEIVCPHTQWRLERGGDWFCSSNDPDNCSGVDPLTAQQVDQFGCDDEGRQPQPVVDNDNIQLITMNLQHWQKDLNLVRTLYYCEPGEDGLR